MLAALVGHHLRQRHAGGARHRGRRGIAGRRLRIGVEHVDDAAPFALFHPSPDQPAETDCSEQLQVEILLPGLVGDIFEGQRARCSGVVDEHVDLAAIGDDPVIGAGDVGGPGYVADIVAHREPVLGERLARCLQIGSPACEDRDRCALTRQTGVPRRSRCPCCRRLRRRRGPSSIGSLLFLPGHDPG